MRRLALSLGLALAVLAAAVAVAVVFRIELATALAREALARNGFPDARFRIERIGLEEIVASEIAAGEALRCERLEIRFELLRLPANPLERVRIARARVDLTALPAAGPAEPPADQGGGSDFSLALLPALELDDVVAIVPSPLGPLTVSVDSRVETGAGRLETSFDGSVESPSVSVAVEGEASREADGTVAASLRLSSLRIRHPRAAVSGGTASLRVAGRSEGWAVREASGELGVSLDDVAAGGTAVGDVTATLPFEAEPADGSWRVRLSGASLRAPLHGIDASGVSGTVTGKSATLRIGRLADTLRNRRFEPVSLRLEATRADGAFAFDGDLSGAGGRVPIEARGRYDPTTGAGKVDLSLPRIELDPDGLRPEHLSPLLGGFARIEGGVSGSASLRLAKGDVTARARIGLHGASIDVPGVHIEKLSGNIELRRVFPPETAGTQVLRAPEIRSGVTLSNAEAHWSLEPAGKDAGSRLRIERFESGFASGKIVVADAVLDPAAPVNRLAFRFEDVALGEVLALTRAEDVSATGTLSGTIPVAVRGGAVEIDEGRLAAGTGVLQVRSQAARDLLAGGGESTKLLLDVLRDFHYEELSVTVEKGFEGESAVRLHLEGNNPEVLDGHPFRINLNLSGNLDRLLGSLLEVARLSDRAVRATVRAAR